MSTSPRQGWHYPDEDQPSWFDSFKSMVDSMDASVYALREGQQLIIMGGGDVTFAATSNTLSWAEDIELSASYTGFLWQIAADSLTVEDGQMIYVRLDRAPSLNVTATFAVGNQLPLPDDYLLFGIRRGSIIYFRSGVSIQDGQTAPIFESGGGGGGGGSTPWSTSAPPVIPIGGTSVQGATSRAAREDHTHGLVASVSAAAMTPGVTGTGGSNASVSRGDHRHALPTGELADIQAIVPGGSSATGSAAKVSRADHAHALATGTPSTVGKINAAGVSTSVPRLDHVHRLEVEVQSGGSTVTSRPILNFTNGTITDDNDNDRVNITIFSTGTVGQYFAERAQLVGYPITLLDENSKQLGANVANPGTLTGTTPSSVLEAVVSAVGVGNLTLTLNKVVGGSEIPVVTLPITDPTFLPSKYEVALPNGEPDGGVYTLHAAWAMTAGPSTVTVYAAQLLTRHVLT